MTLSRLRADALLLLAALLWGVTFVPQKTAMAAIGPLTFIAARFALSAVVIAPFAWWEIRKTPLRLTGFDKLLALAIGVALFAGMSLQQVGLTATTATNGGFLTALYVCFTPLVAWAMFGARPGLIVLLAAILCIGGVWLLGGGALSALSYGDYLIIGCAICFAFQITLVGYAMARFSSPMFLALVQFTVCAALGLGGMAATGESPSLSALSQAMPELFFAGVVAGSLAFGLQIIGQRHTSPADAAVIFGAEALFAAFAGWIVLGDHLTPLAWTGGALIFCGILLVGLFPSNALAYFGAGSEGLKCGGDMANPPQPQEFRDENVMRPSLFAAASNGAADEKVSANTKFGCRTCWYVYDPSKGEDAHHTSAGATFAALSENWVCPVCHGPKDDFIAIDD